MAFLMKIAFMLFKGILWTLITMVYVLVAERVLIHTIKMAKRFHLGLVKTTILRPVVALKK